MRHIYLIYLVNIASSSKGHSSEFKLITVFNTEDIFTIDEVTMYEGEWTEKNYAVAGDILDGQLYDLFMNMLDERGVTQQFADNLSEYCSAYEHSRYIKMLEDVHKFVQK